MNRNGIATSWIGCLIVLAFGGCAVEAGEIEDAETALRTGRYSDAISLFQAQLDGGTDDVRVVRGLARALGSVGRYSEAEDALRGFLDAHPDTAQGWNSLGEVHYSQGEIEAARRAFETALVRRAADRLTAQVNLAVLEYEGGELDTAFERFYSLIDAYNSRSELAAPELTAVGTACRFLGVDDPQLYKDALKAYDEAVAADPSYLEPRIRVGELFLEKYNSTEARHALEAVLEVNPQHPAALLAAARVLDFENSPEALEQVKKSLEVNPNFVPARVFLAELLLKLEQHDEAAREANRALEINPRSLAAQSVLAGAHYLRGNEAEFEEVRRQALERNPHYAEFYNVLADVCVYNRLYQEAAQFAQQAVKLDPKSWRGYGLLGLNQLRLGQMEEGRAHLDTAFAGDPYNVWIKNTLDLLDTFPNYRETRTPRFHLVIDGKESALLAPYMGALAEEAYGELARRYQYEPPTPIRLEVYPSHADFSVRTVGLAGLGALGVSFGPVMAIDSPSAREIGAFNWGSTLWHELAHTFTLGLTEHKIPRWLTEGISVYEERRARPGWGDDVRPEFLDYFKQGKLLPLAEFNNGFVRPDSPAQIAFSYYQASLVVELIEESYGHETLLEILAGYREGQDTAEIFHRVLDLDTEAFDEKLAAMIEKRFATALAALSEPEEEPGAEELEGVVLRRMPSKESIAQAAEENPGDFRSQLRYGLLLYSEEDFEQALPYLERAKALFPQFAGEASPYLPLARIYRRQGKLERAAEELATLTAIDETHYEAHLELADLREELDDPEGAAWALDRILYIYPMKASLHTRLARLYEELGEEEKVIRERAAVVALPAVDRAEALYQLALAYFRAGQLDGARRQVLRALEIAPSFEQALDLLLEIRAGDAGSAPKTEGEAR